MQLDFAVELFRPAFASEVASLIVQIQHDEFGLPISAADQPDLAIIPDFYQAGDGNFWVAISHGRVVGTVALKDIGKLA
jgi:hypothetical protein